MTTLDSQRDPPPLELRLESQKASVSDARRRMAEYAESVGANRNDVELAVAEAVANAVVHAFSGRDDGRITVRAEIDPSDRLVVEVADLGSGITTHPRPRGRGFGLPIIGALADEVEIRTGGHGTRLMLRFLRVS